MPESLHEIIKAVHESESRAEASLQEIRVYVLNNHTVDNLRWFLQGLGYREGLKIIYTQGPYDAIMQEVLQPGSAFDQTRPEVVVLSLLFESLVPDFALNQFSVADVTERLRRMIEAITSKSTAIVVANTFLLPPYSADGIAGSRIPHSLGNKIRAVNERYRRLAEETPNVYLIDFNLIEQHLGIARSRDYRLWFTAKALLTNKFLQAYADEIFKVLRALKGKSKKCLVLDCDGTLWGGLAGEDGLEGIRLDAHEYPGNIFYRFQQNVLALLERGAILCLCSKNNPEDVWEILDTHPHCLIKRSHLAAWRINWESKASNIESLAEELNLAIDGFVFVDDQRMECELVQESLPGITALQVPSNLFAFPNLLFEHGGFDTLSVVEEDKRRGKMYQVEAVRKKNSERYRGLDEFLSTLGMVASIRPAQASEIQRIAQLTQKTNQFNLTTRRYSEGEILKFAEDPDCGVFSLSVKDRFGDLGLTGVLIARREGQAARVDTFLMSCRILGRKLEHAFLNTCMSHLEEKWQLDSWTSEYLPTRKNQQVAGFWPQLGFSEMKHDNGAKFYSLRVRQRNAVTVPFIHVIKE